MLDMYDKFVSCGRWWMDASGCNGSWRLEVVNWGWETDCPSLLSLLVQWTMCSICACIETGLFPIRFDISHEMFNVVDGRYIRQCPFVHWQTANMRRRWVMSCVVAMAMGMFGYIRGPGKQANGLWCIDICAYLIFFTWELQLQNYKY